MIPLIQSSLRKVVKLTGSAERAKYLMLTFGHQWLHSKMLNYLPQKPAIKNGSTYI